MNILWRFYIDFVDIVKVTVKNYFRFRGHCKSYERGHCKSYERGHCKSYEQWFSFSSLAKLLLKDFGKYIA